jgi:hypothetical protein
MTTNSDEEIKNSPRKAILSGNREGGNAIEAGENGMKIEVRDLGSESMNSSTGAVSETVTQR